VKHRLAVGLMVAALALPGAAAGARQQDTRALLKQIEVLRARLNALEKKVRERSPSPGKPATGAAKAAGGERGKKPAAQGAVSGAVTGTPYARRRTGTRTGKPAAAAKAASKAPGKSAGQARPIKIGGALWLNYARKSYVQADRRKGGNLGFDLFRLDVNGSLDNILISAQYRWYSYMNVVHHAWLGYKFSKQWQGQVGITQVPFGLLPYASHNYWFGVPYYMGLEDDYDTGLKFVGRQGPWKLDLAFFKNAEWGNPAKLDRYSFDVVTQGSQANEETNQLNARVAYTFGAPKGDRAVLGLSGEWGQLYNATTHGMGEHWAAAAHVNGYYGPWNLQLEAVRYRYNPHNPAGVSDGSVLMGAFGTSHLVASEGNLWIANVARSFPVSWGPVRKLTCYNDFSLLDKATSGWPDSKINTTGCLIHAGPVYTYVDLIKGKNMPLLGGAGDAMAQASGGGGWNTRFNINMEYYF